MDKKRKAEEKRQRRTERKIAGTKSMPLADNEVDEEVLDQPPEEQGEVE
ncbi:MAG: hypothetical protein ACE361_14780 [Aureliella sp.]